ncbi:MAG: hypothetical protein IPK19_13830 [Chloroflexi bacterium]|nr:hypothetical protein [Chloroflexota bacterium]
MKRAWLGIGLFLTLMLMAGVLPVEAQDMVYQLGEGYFITLPDGWTIEADSDGTQAVYIYSPDASLNALVLPAHEMREYVVANRTLDIDEVVTEMLEIYEEPTGGSITHVAIDGRAVAYAADSVGYTIVVQMSDGWYGAILSVTDLSVSRAADLIVQLAAGFDGEQVRGAAQDLTGEPVKASEGGNAASTDAVAAPARSAQQAALVNPARSASRRATRRGCALARARTAGRSPSCRRTRR